MKHCSKCHTDKEVEDFCKDSKMKDGLQSWCKSCKSKSNTQYYKENPHKKGVRTKEQGRERYYRNRINFNMSRIMRRSLQGNKSGRSWEKLAGYSIQDLKLHLQALFKEGMTFENYGKWHIDHIRPIDSFNITSSECDDFNMCWSLNNLQPLWAEENQLKHNKFPRILVGNKIKTNV